MQDTITVLTAPGARNGGVVHTSIDFTTVALCYDAVKAVGGGGGRSRPYTSLAGPSLRNFNDGKDRESAKFEPLGCQKKE